MSPNARICVATANDLFKVVASGKVKIPINQKYPLKDAVKAHRELEGRENHGLVDPDSLIVSLQDARAMDVFLGEWANLLLRWAHMIVGIGWIGTSFYFIALDYSLNREGARQAACSAPPGRCMAAASITSRNTQSRRRSCRRICIGFSGRRISPG